MPDKILFNIKDDAYNRFFLCYVGARMISVNITKSSLINQMVQNAINEEINIIKDCNNKWYTGKDLYNLGIDAIRTFFDLMNNKHDSILYRKSCEIGINNENIKNISCFDRDYKKRENNDLQIFDSEEKNEKDNSLEDEKNKIFRRNIIIKLLKVSSDMYMSNKLMIDTVAGRKKEVNLSDGDYENLAKVITYIDKASPFNTDFDYNFGREINILISRMKMIFSKVEHYKFLSNIILNAYNNSYLIDKYEIVSCDSIRESFDLKIKFYHEILEILKEKSYSEEEIEKLSNFYKNIAIDKIESKECKEKCEECFFRKDKCYPKWAFEDMKLLLIEGLSLDITKCIKMDDFYSKNIKEAFNIQKPNIMSVREK
ncbi:MAG: hypothetical protein SPE00_07845 [Bacilli bacterium]|nr:hypothetical protein [Bacilli bacterium]